MKRIILIAVALAFAPFAGAQLYKHVDKDGKVTYTDQPPANADAKAVNIPKSALGDAPPAKSFVAQDKDLDKKRKAELLERFDLDPRKKARAYSKGNRQKVALVAAFASDVELLLLDEPTSGLDPLMEEVFRDVVQEISDRDGRTVLLSSHILSEVEALCDRVTIIRAGRAVESGTLSELRHLTRTSIQAELVGPMNGLAQLSGVHDLNEIDGHVQFDVDKDEINPVLRRLTEIGVRSLVSQPPSLEELFLRLYEPEAVK